MKSIEEKILKYIPMEDTGDCWEWTGSKTPPGYGYIIHNGTHIYGHRFIYELMIDKIPDKYDIDHLCRNTSCCNPFHLEAVTHRENVLRGNGLAAKNARKENCAKGHIFTAKIRGDGRSYRICMECNRQWFKDRKQKTKEEGIAQS